MAFHTIIRIGAGIGLAAGLALGVPAQAQNAATSLAASKPATQNWTTADQALFYVQDQGSRMIPLRWLQALKQRDRKTPFLADSLARYGYLPNMDSPVAGLPVGFQATRGDGNDSIVGMTCAACHTREIRVGGAPMRIDGGPAFVDFFTLMKDLDDAVTYALGEGWVEFAQAVPQPVNKAELRRQVQAWADRFQTLMRMALTGTPWGLSRLDAVSMIFNRLTGLDLGTEQNNYLIPENIKAADAPVRYPFLWNAGRQDKTQWPGFTSQSSSRAPLGRNIGEVFGVFAHFTPQENGWFDYFGPVEYLLKYNYLNNNSVQFSGLKKLEELITALEPPRYPAYLDQGKADKGRLIYYAHCKSCHDLPTTTERASWTTPIQNVRTDGKEWDVLVRDANPGSLTGASIRWPLVSDPTLNTPLKNPSSAVSILSIAVVGSIVQYTFSLIPWRSGTDNNMVAMAPAPGGASTPRTAASTSDLLNAKELLKSRGVDTEEFAGMIKAPKKPAPAVRSGAPSRAARSALAGAEDVGSPICDPGHKAPCYESRVLYGIWAAAPYLHNGSVPTLWDLLTPAKDRPEEFNVGGDYDLVKVGLANVQTGLRSIMKTTDCEDTKSGNSRCGHEFGTTLSDEEKWALIEYLKGL